MEEIRRYQRGHPNQDKAKAFIDEIYDLFIEDNAFLSGGPLIEQLNSYQLFILPGDFKARETEVIIDHSKLDDGEKDLLSLAIKKFLNKNSLSQIKSIEMDAFIVRIKSFFC